MNTHSCSTSGRRLFAPWAAARPRDRHTRASLGVVDLEARPGPAAAPGTEPTDDQRLVALRAPRHVDALASRVGLPRHRGCPLFCC